MAEIIQCGRFVTPSEREVASRLKDLPANWTVICNKEVVTPAGDTYEVDFVIVGDHVIFAIDEKSWSGDIYGNENVWVLPGGEPRRSPLQKIGHVGRQLAGVLRGRVPYLHEHAQQIHFVIDMVLLSARDCRLRVADPRIGTHVVRIQDALEELQRVDKDNPTLDLNVARQVIRTHLTDLRNRPQFPQRINAFTVLEVLLGGRGYRDFLVQHADGGRRLLKLYELDPVEQPRNAGARRSRIQVRRRAIKGDAVRRSVSRDRILPLTRPPHTSTARILVPWPRRSGQCNWNGFAPGERRVAAGILGNFHNAVTTKLKDWQHEQEYRATLQIDMDLTDRAARKLQYRFEDLQGIIFGIKTPLQVKIEIARIVQEKCKETGREDFELHQAYYSRLTGRIATTPWDLVKLN